MPSLPLVPAGDDALAASHRVGDAWAWVAAIGHGDVREARSRTRRLIETRPDPLARTERPGHLTGSAFVVDAAARRTLLLLHTKLQIWVQPGGHADGDANLAAVALREAEEETGIAGLRVHPQAIDLDIHRVAPPTEDAHDHHDVRFLVVAPAGAVVDTNDESQAHRWLDEDELARAEVDPGVLRMARRGFALARSLICD